VKDKVPDMEEIQRQMSELGKRMQFNISPETDAGGVDDSDSVNEEEFDLTFDMKPKDVKAYLDKYVIKQEEAKKILSIAVCDHYNHIAECARQKKEQSDSNDPEEEYAKQNVMMIGPTGVGKTYLIKTIAKLIGVPFVKADATKFSETGYVGGNVDDMVRDLVNEADGNIELAQYGIIYIDEIDKIAVASNVAGRDVSGRGVQSGLLKLMEETEVELTTPYDPVSQMRAFMEFQKKGKVEKEIINTKHILFFVSGAFNQLEDVIKKRLQKNEIGFGAVIESKKSGVDYMKDCGASDLVEYGFEPEFIGRMPVRVVCYELSAEDLYNILQNSEGTIIKQYERAFKAYGIDVIFSDESLRIISEKAYEEKTGARALATICEKAMREFKFELPSSDVKGFIVTAEMVENPVGELKTLLANPNQNKRFIVHEIIKKYEKEFMHKHKIKLKFSEEAIELISEKAAAGETDAWLVCDRILKDYEYGLKLIERNTGKSEFTITKAAIEDPSGTLDEWFKKYYTNQPEHA